MKGLSLHVVLVYNLLEIYRNCEMLLRTKDTTILEKVNKYFGFVKKAGRRMVVDDKINS